MTIDKTISWFHFLVMLQCDNQVGWFLVVALIPDVVGYLETKPSDASRSNSMLPAVMMVVQSPSITWQKNIYHIVDQNHHF